MKILEKWPIGPVATIEPTPGGDRTSFVTTVDNEYFVLKETHDRVRSQREYALLRKLSQAGVSVPLPITAVDGDWYVVNNKGQAFWLYPKLAGEVVAEHYTGDAEQQAEALGKAIGFLHGHLQACGDLSGFRDMNLIGQIQEWAIPCIRTGKAMVDAEAIEKIWRDAEEEFVPLYDDLPKQLIHRDAHPANMLFDNGRLTGFLDFELAVRGRRVFDICYCASAILVDGFQDQEKARKWHTLFRSIVSGYEIFYPLSSSERLAVYGVLVAITLLFTAFWLDIRSDEDAAKNTESLLYWLSDNRQTLIV
ncbi:MAG: phosphotransferase [Chloroflexi bacterium]|nr:phosphotransferase [Chloroflexota bacterium]